MTTAEPNADEQRRGRHAKPDDDDRPDNGTQDDGSPDGGSPDGARRAEVQQDDGDRDGDTQRDQPPTDVETTTPDGRPDRRTADRETTNAEAAHAEAGDEEAVPESRAAEETTEDVHSGEEVTGEDSAPESRADEESADGESAEEESAGEEPAEEERSDESSAAQADVRGDNEAAVEEQPSDEQAARDDPAPQQASGAAAPAGQRVAEKSREERPGETAKKRSGHALAHHPAGASLLTASGLVTGLALVPLLFDQLNFEVGARAADAARSAAPWPGGSEAWFWPGWVGTTAALVALVVLVIAAVGVRVPDVAVLVTAVALAAATARAAWATFDVLNAHLWELVPLCIVCVLAFGSAATAAFRRRSPDSDDKGTGAGEVAGVTVGTWLLVVLLLLGGSAIASSAQTHAFGNVTSPPQDLAGLLSVRAADAPALDDLRGSWVPQVAVAQATDDAAATAYAVVHHGWTTRFPTLLARGDDVPGLDDTWWLSIAAQPFASQAEAAAFCATTGQPGCTPLQVGG